MKRNSLFLSLGAGLDVMASAGLMLASANAGLAETGQKETDKRQNATQRTPRTPRLTPAPTKSPCPAKSFRAPKERSEDPPVRSKNTEYLASVRACSA